MAASKLTLLIEDLHQVAAAGSAGQYPALETLLARSSKRSSKHAQFDRLRFALTGFDGVGALPVAAVTHAVEAPGQAPSPGCDYWLRADPVTLQAGMTQVVMTGYGCNDLYPDEQKELAAAVGEVMREDGLAFEAPAGDRWYVGLDESPGFDFPPLAEALGADAAEMTSNHPGAKYWRKLMTEVQMVMHAHPVNSRRRDMGKTPVNSIWFWGGGTAPATPSAHGVDRVFSDQPLSRGLAVLSQTDLDGLSALADWNCSGRKGEKSVLVDWSHSGQDANQHLERIDEFLAGLLPSVRKGKLALVLAAGNGQEWVLNARSARRFWRRQVALEQYARR